MGIIIGLLGFLVAATGCSLLQEQGPEMTYWEPELSPDGETLAYEDPIDGDLELFTLNLRTKEIRRLTRSDGPDWSPSWSPDGLRLAFASSREENADIYVVDLQTLSTFRLTTDEADDINPSWGVDNRIYFNSNRSDVWEIYTIDPNGGNLVKITQVTPAAQD